MTHARIPDFAVPHPLPVSVAFPVPAPSDPVLLVIEAHAEAWAVYQLAPAGRPAEEAEDALSAALEDLLAAPCLTRFGALALVRHLRWLIREEAIVAETADLCGRVALAREADLSRFVGSDLPPEHLPHATPLGRLAPAAVRTLPPPSPAPLALPAPSRLARAAGTAGEALAALVLIGGGTVLAGLATLL